MNQIVFNTLYIRRKKIFESKFGLNSVLLTEQYLNEILNQFFISLNEKGVNQLSLIIRVSTFDKEVYSYTKFTDKIQNVGIYKVHIHGPNIKNPIIPIKFILDN